MENSVSTKWVEHLPVPKIADDLIRDNHFSPKQIQEIRDVEYHSNTSEEFWKSIEERKFF